MGDVFDTITLKEPKKDVFNSVASETSRGDIFDSIEKPEVDIFDKITTGPNIIQPPADEGISSIWQQPAPDHDFYQNAFGSEQNVNRPRSEELIDAAARGLASTGSAGANVMSALSRREFGSPFVGPGYKPIPEQQREKEKQEWREKAKFLWELSKNPELASQNKDIASKGLNLIGETVPYITATTAGYLMAGPLGGFAVGSLVEGNSAYRTALDYNVPEDKAKAIGVGVGIVSGAIESVGGKYAEQLFNKAAYKIKDKILKRGAQFGIGMIIEALEEAGQEIAQITGEKTYREVNWDEGVNRTLSSAAGGAFLGGVMKGGGVATRIAIKSEEKAMQAYEGEPVRKLPTEKDLVREINERNRAQREQEQIEKEFIQQNEHLRSIKREYQRSPKDQARRDVRQKKMMEMPIEELEDKLSKTSIKSPFFKEMVEVWEARTVKTPATGRQISAPESLAERTQAPETKTPQVAEKAPEIAEKTQVAFRLKSGEVITDETAKSHIELIQKQVTRYGDLEEVHDKMIMEEGAEAGWIVNGKFQPDLPKRPSLISKEPTDIEQFGIKQLQKSKSLKGITDKEALNILRAKNAIEKEDAVKQILRNRGIDTHKIDIPQYDIRGTLQAGEEYRPTIKGKKPSHQEAINLAVEEAMADVTDVIDVQIPEFEKSLISKEPKKPILTKATLPKEDSLFYLSFDETGKIPTAKELQDYLNDNDIGAKASVQRFQRDIVSTTKGSRSYRIDVYDQNARLSKKLAAELYKAKIGEGNITEQTKAQREIPLEQRFGAVVDYAKKKLTEVEGVTDDNKTQGQVVPLQQGRQEEAGGAVQQPRAGGEQGEAGELVQTPKERELVQTGITSTERRTYIKQQAEQIRSNDIYQNELAALEDMAAEVGPGFYYIDKGYRGEVEAIIGKRKGFPTAIQKMFTFNPNEKRIVNLPDGSKTEIGPIAWESAVQEGLGRGKQGVDQTWGEMDISDFVQRVVDSYMAGEEKGGINLAALERAKASNDPGMQLAVLKYEMLDRGVIDTEINNAISDWADEWGIDQSEIIDEYVGADGNALQKIAALEGTDQENAIDELAKRQAEREDRKNAVEAAKEILEANDIKADIQEFKDLPLKPDDDIPFSRRRGRPIGAALTQGQRETVLLAFGADSETGYHEAYHILRRRLTDKDRSIMDREFKGDQEVEARSFANYAKTGKAKSILRAIWQKLVNLLRKIKSGLQGRGFRTAKDVFAGIRSGKIIKGQPKTGKAFEMSEREREIYRQAYIDAQKDLIRKKVSKKKPKVSKRRIKLNIVDTTPPLREDLAPTPKIKDIGKPLTEEPPAGKGRTPTKVRLSDRFYEENRKKYRRTLTESVGEFARRRMLGFDRAVTVMSSRLSKVDEGLKYAVRRYAFNVHKRTTDLIKDVQPMTAAMKKFKKADKRDFKFAVLNNQRGKINEIIDKYDIREEYEQYREVMDELFEAGNEVGMDILYRGDYWPRVVKDINGLLKYLQTTEKWAPIQQALFKRQQQAGGRELTESEKANVINTLLRGYRIGGVSLSRPGATKERTIDTFDSQIEPYYHNLKDGLQHYIQNMVQVISAREFFGRQTTELRNLMANRSRVATRLYKTSRRIGYKKTWSEEKYDTHISEAKKKLDEIEKELAKKKAQTLEDSVGWYVKDLVLAKKITPQQQTEIAQMFRAIFEPKGPSGAVRTFMKLGYIDTLANPSVALTQLEELGLSVYKNAIRSLPAVAKSAIGRSELKLADIGVTDINQYMEDLGFRELGDKLLFMMQETDKLGKQAFINTTLSDFRAQATRKNLKADFLNKMRRMFGDDYKQVIKDLKDGKVTEDIKFLAFSELSDVQPVSIAETPEYYARGGNARILYMLRSFTIRRFDMLRNRARKIMVNPARHPVQFLAGLGDMIKLLGILTVFGVGKDAVRAWFLGKDFELLDSVIDNILQYVLLSRYTADRAKKEGFGSAVSREISPPTKFIDALINDVKKGKIDRTVRSVPIFGENYYWWFGGGANKGQESTWGD